MYVTLFFQRLGRVWQRCRPYVTSFWLYVALAPFAYLGYAWHTVGFAEDSPFWRQNPLYIQQMLIRFSIEEGMREDFIHIVISFREIDNMARWIRGLNPQNFIQEGFSREDAVAYIQTPAFVTVEHEVAVMEALMWNVKVECEGMNRYLSEHDRADQGSLELLRITYTKLLFYTWLADQGIATQEALRKRYVGNNPYAVAELDMFLDISRRFRAQQDVLIQRMERLIRESFYFNPAVLEQARQAAERMQERRAIFGCEFLPPADWRNPDLLSPRAPAGDEAAAERFRGEPSAHAGAAVVQHPLPR